MSNETTLDDVLALHVADLRRVAKLLSPFGNFTAVKVEVGKAADELEALLPAIKAALEDAARLDALERIAFTMYRNRDPEGQMVDHVTLCNEDAPGSRRGILGDTVRSAIDAAQEVG